MTDKPDERLLPCPFCGGEADYFANGSVSHPDIIVHRVACNCDCQPFTGWRATKAEAIAAWNRRSAHAVKALDWTEVTSPREDGPAEPTGDWNGKGAFGVAYCVYIFEDHYEVTRPDGEYVEEYLGDVDEAKAAAQADYTARIRSALEPERAE